MSANDVAVERFSERTRFLALALPGVLFVIVFLIIPIISIVVFSFWRTESYDLIPEWSLDNYETLLSTTTYMTFLWRSFSMAVVVSVACMIYGWPIAYFIARYGGRYKLLLILGLAAPFFTGAILRVTALQSIMGPVGALNMAVMAMGGTPIEMLMFSPTATTIGMIYLYMPFMVTAIYLSLLNFDFELLEVAKINGAKSWRAFFEVTWPLNWMGTAIGLIMTFIPVLAAAVEPIFLGGPSGASYGSVLSKQFSESGTWALGSAMGVVLFLLSCAVITVIWFSVDLRRSGYTGRNNG
ncbi:MAG: ABC transporter permease [Rhodobacterales bacterium]|nr:ABC transporter permease [Rhodobacterales bacterium]